MPKDSWKRINEYEKIEKKQNILVKFAIMGLNQLGVGENYQTAL